MSKFYMVEVAFDNREEVDNTSKLLLDMKLVSSCHVIVSDSSWNWKGERESKTEFLLQMKTKDSCLKDIYEEVKKIHSYECFEFATYEITSYNKDYLDWIEEETK